MCLQFQIAACGKENGENVQPEQRKGQTFLFLSDLSCSFSLVVFPKKKTPDWPSGKCTKTLVLGVILSVLMEVKLSVSHPSVLLSFSLKME